MRLQPLGTNTCATGIAAILDAGAARGRGGPLAYDWTAAYQTIVLPTVLSPVRRGCPSHRGLRRKAWRNRHRRLRHRPGRRSTSTSGSADTPAPATDLSRDMLGIRTEEIQHPRRRSRRRARPKSACPTDSRPACGRTTRPRSLADAIACSPRTRVQSAADWELDG